MWISRDFWGAEAPRIPAFLFWKRALAVSTRFQAVLLFQGGRLFRFLTQLFRAWKRAPEEMEVKSEESKPSKSQVKQNQTGIPFPHRASRTDWKARLYCIPTVRGMPLSRVWFSVSGWGRRMYAHAIDEAIWKGGTQMNMPFPSRGQVEFTRSCYPPGTRIVLYWTPIKIFRKDFNCPKGTEFLWDLFCDFLLINHKTGSAVRRCLPD